MSKALCILGLAISALLLAIFGLDLATGFPFDGENTVMDIGYIIAAATLGFLSWSTMREVT